MSLFIIIIYTITISTIIVLSILLFKNLNSSANKAFFFYNIALLVWAISNLLTDISSTEAMALFWSRMSIIGPAFLPAVFVLFSRLFLNKEVKKIFFIFVFLPTIPILALVNTDYNIVSIDPNTLGQGVATVAGCLYYYLFLYFIVFNAYGFYILFRGYRHSVGLRRLQIKYIILGFLIGLIWGVVTNLVLVIFNVSGFAFLGPIGASILATITSYAILRYRLMDIRLIIKRTTVFAVLIILITALYASLAFLISQFFSDLIGSQSVILNGIITAVLVAVGFKPLEHWLSTATDNYLFKAEYNPQQLLAEFSEKLSSTLDLDILNQFIVKKLDQTFKPEKITLCLYDETKKEFFECNFISDKNSKTKNFNNEIYFDAFEYLKTQGLEKSALVKDEIRKQNEKSRIEPLSLLATDLEKQAYNLVVPLFVQDRLIGLLFLGDKKSGDVYSMEDLRVLEIVAGQGAVSIQNSQLFEEQKNFAIHLKREVDKATKELQIANVELRKLDKAKSEFISIASHQLRTPLTIINGYISMLEQGDYGNIPSKVKDPLDKVHKSTLRIINLVEDLLNISRIESGRLEYEFHKTDMKWLIKEVFEELEMHGKNKMLKMDLNLSEEKIPDIIIDQKKIREVLMNLIDNAIKYTDSGRVKVSLDKINGHLQVMVKDTGRGIEEDEQSLLFKKFSRTKGAQLRHTEGTGLGLYIAKQIVTRHDGKIWAESKGRNKGSTFYIQFKIKNHKLEKLAKKK